MSRLSSSLRSKQHVPCGGERGQGVLTKAYRKGVSILSRPKGAVLSATDATAIYDLDRGPSSCSNNVKAPTFCRVVVEFKAPVFSTLLPTPAATMCSEE